MTGDRTDPKPGDWSIELPSLPPPTDPGSTPAPAARRAAPAPEDDEIRRSLAEVLRAARSLQESVAEQGSADDLEWVDVPDDGEFGVEFDPEESLPSLHDEDADGYVAPAPEHEAGSEAEAEDQDEPEAADDAEAGPPRRLSATTELLVAFGAGIALERWMFGELRGFVGVVPSPYWIALLWLSLRHGLLCGLAAATAATLLQALGLFVTLGLPDPAAILDLELMWEPVLFFVAAFLTGQMRDAMTRRHDDLRHRLLAMRAAVRARDEDVDALVGTNRDLARRLFEQAFDLEGVMRALGRVRSSSENDVVEVALSMLTEQCGATRCSMLLVLTDGTVDLLAERGWDEREIGDRLRIAARSAQVRRALTESRAVIAPRESAGVDRGPVMVAPISDGTGVIKALLCVDAMPAERFDESAVQGFVGVAEWVVSALRRVQLGQVKDDARAVVFRALDEGKAIADSDELAARIHVDDQRRRRYSTPTTMLALHVREPVGGAEASDSWLSLTLGSVLGPTDDLFRFGYSGCYVAVLTGSEAEVARERAAAVRDAGGGPQGLRVEAFAPDDRHPTLAELLPAMTAFFCGASKVALDSRCPVPEPRAGRPGYAAQFARRLRLEIELAETLGTEVSLLDFRAAGGPGDAAVGPMIGRHLWNRGEEVLRATDGVFVLSPARCVVILPFTGSLDAARIWRRLDALLRVSIPDGRYEDVESEFLSLAGADARDTLEHLLGKPVGGRTVSDGPILTESELKELAFAGLETGPLGGESSAFEEFGVPRAVEPMPAERAFVAAPAPAVKGLPDVLEAFERIVGDLRDIGGALQRSLGDDGDAVRPQLARLIELCGPLAEVDPAAASEAVAAPPDSAWLLGDAAVGDPWATDDVDDETVATDGVAASDGPATKPAEAADDLLAGTWLAALEGDGRALEAPEADVAAAAPGERPLADGDALFAWNLDTVPRDDSELPEEPDDAESAWLADDGGAGADPFAAQVSDDEPERAGGGDVPDPWAEPADDAVAGLREGAPPADGVVADGDVAEGDPADAADVEAAPAAIEPSADDDIASQPIDDAEAPVEPGEEDWPNPLAGSDPFGYWSLRPSDSDAEDDDA